MKSIKVEIRHKLFCTKFLIFHFLTDVVPLFPKNF